MLEIPRRDGLSSLTIAANAIVKTSALGFARALPGGKVSILYSYGFGLGQFELPVESQSVAVDPSADGLVLVDRAGLETRRAHAVEAFLLDNHTQHLVSVPVGGLDPPVRLWVGLTDPQAPSPEQLRGLEDLTPQAAALLNRSLGEDVRLQRLLRLEQASELIPALLHVLDVREVIDRLSATATRALPHDRLFLNLFSEDLSTATVYARSDKGTGVGMVMPNPYPAATIQAWRFSIVDDHLLHPMERNAPSTKAGIRSSLRFPIRFDDRVNGGVSFLSFTPGAFSDADVPIGLRLSEHVASAISHFRMAERLAREARETEELRAQATNLELLDDLLAALIDAGELADVFERISATAMKVLPHDGAALMVRLPDGHHARLYASSGFPKGLLPEIGEIPPAVLDPSWEHDIVDDLRTAEPQAARGVAAGFQSRLRVTIRLEGVFAGALVFASRSLAAFKPSDILVARLMADRMAGP